MSNPIHSVDFINPLSYLASTEQSAQGLAKENIGKLNAPYEPWRAVAAVANEWVGFDAGAATPIANAYAVCDRVNVDKLRFEAADNAAFSTNLLTSAILTTAADPLDGRRKYLYKLSTLGTGSRRYFRWRADATAVTVDGSSAFMVGSAAVVTTHVAWTYPFTYPRGERSLRAVRANDTRAGGGRRPVGVGNRYCRLTLSCSNWPYSMRGTFLDFNGIGEDQIILFCPNPAVPTEVYLCYLVGSVELVQAGVNKLTVAGVLLEEGV